MTAFVGPMESGGELLVLEKDEEEARGQGCARETTCPGRKSIKPERRV